MTKRTSTEARIVEWFQTAPVAEVEIVFGIVKLILKRRQGGGANPTRRGRPPKQQAEAAPSPAS